MLKNQVTVPKAIAVDLHNELLSIVDENDIEVGTATRVEIHRRAWRHRAIHIVVCNSKGLVLLQRRSLLKDTYPGFWDVSVGGHVGTSETYEEAALRELAEELGVRNTSLAHVAKLKASMLTHWEFLEIFSCEHDGPFTFPHEEISQLQWMHPDDILQRAARDRAWNMTRSGVNSIRAWCELQSRF